MQTIRIQIREVYGAPKAYPICEHASTFASMLGTKTLTRNALGHILKLGFTVVEVSRHGGEIARYSAGSNTSGHLMARVD